MTNAEPSLVSRLSDLNPFAKSRRRNDDEDLGEATDFTSVAERAHGVYQFDATNNQLRVSDALKTFLTKEGVVASEPEGLGTSHTSELQALIDKPHISVPSLLTDRSYPLPEYFISSSHNTYLMAHQLYGSSSASAYETVLHAGSRCVEIDAWDNEDDKDEPRVTHGYTLVSNIPFRAVCETIREVVDKEASQPVNRQGYHNASPLLISLENHCDPQGQLRLVQIMKEVWGHRVLSEAIRRKGHEEQAGLGDHVTLADLGSKINVIVEYHFPNKAEESDTDSDSSSEEEESRLARQAYREKKKASPATIIIPELAAMGVYAQSVKPIDSSWFEEVGLSDGPHHHLINVSEAGLGSYMPSESERIARHNATHLMRVYPKGTRISSRNLRPVPFWGLGAQICALNMQTFDASYQLNEALFSGTDGFVLKPAALRAGGNGRLSTGKMKRLRLCIAGATDIPIPEGREDDDIKPYVTCSMIHPDELKDNPKKRKTGYYRRHKLEILHKGHNPPVTDPIWHETLEWEYEDNELIFLRILIKSDDKFASNPKLAVIAVRLLYASSGWNFIRMRDLKGRKTKCSMLVKFEVENA